LAAYLIKEGTTQETIVKDQFLQGQTKTQNMPKAAGFSPLAYLLATCKKNNETPNIMKPA
jgi:hypothetical protein